jgi:hypothetical protein
MRHYVPHDERVPMGEDRRSLTAGGLRGLDAAWDDRTVDLSSLPRRVNRCEYVTSTDFPIVNYRRKDMNSGYALDGTQSREEPSVMGARHESERLSALRRPRTGARTARERADELERR